MSFSDAVSQVDQIVQWEQQLGSGAPFSRTSAANTGGASGTAAAAGGSTDSSSGSTGSTSGSAATSSATATFADALAQAQTSEESSLLDPTSDTGSTDPSAAGTSDLLSGGDSQLLSLLSSLASGSAATPAATTTAATTTGAITGATSAAITAATGATSAPEGGTATSPADPRLQAMLQEANSLLGEPYVWGGGHGSWGAQSGYDCSGFVSAVLHAGGYLSSPQDTTTLPSAAGIESGPGQYVTIYDRDAPGQEGHVIIDIAGQFYESGGEQGSWGGGGGVEKIATPPASYLATFNLVLHPEGL